MVLFMHCSSTAMMTDASSVSRRKMKNATTLKISWKATISVAVCGAVDTGFFWTADDKAAAGAGE
jgi:hypothetical protein